MDLDKILHLLLILSRSRLGLLRVSFRRKYTSVMAFGSCKNFLSAQFYGIRSKYTCIVHKGSTFLKDGHFIIQERFYKLIESINTIIKCDI